MAVAADNVKKVGRKRRAAGWTLLMLGVFVAGVWVASGWWVLGRVGKTWSAGVVTGTLAIVCDQPPPSRSTPGLDGDWASVKLRPAHWEFQSLNARYFGTLTAPQWSWFIGKLNAKEAVTEVPLLVAIYGKYDYTNTQLGAVEYRLDIVLWPIPLLLWTPAALLLRSGILARRRALQGACPKCGYSLAGLGEGAACPECGKVSGDKAES